nr:hypothetical protein Cry52Nrm2_p089 [Cryptomonas curvata]
MRLLNTLNYKIYVPANNIQKQTILSRNKKFEKNKFFFFPINMQYFIISSLIKPYYTISLHKKIRGFFSAKNDITIFSKYIEGNFDNQSQFLSFFNVSQNVVDFPRLEHIHCNITKLGKTSNGKIFLIALYYFPGIELKFFRIRYYTLYPCEFSSHINPLIAMEIYRVISEDGDLKFLSDNLTKNYQISKQKNAIKFNHCTVFWKKKKTNKDQTQNQLLFKGHLHEGGCSILSIISKYFLHINDDLILTDKVLLVNDRGFDEELFLIYGNNKEIFFQLDKINRGEWFDWVFL